MFLNKNPVFMVSPVCPVISVTLRQSKKQAMKEQTLAQDVFCYRVVKYIGAYARYERSGCDLLYRRLRRKFR